MGTISKSAVLCVSLLVAFGGTPMATADVLPDITVTAQRREQKAQDVGIAMTTMTGEELTQRHYTSASDIVAQTPGVEARNQFPSRGLRTNYFIRGIGSTDFNDATEAPVAIYVDDFYMISPSTADFSLMDISRAEVLKGPQSTLFGRNSNGGALQFVTNKPQFDAVSGDFEGGVGTNETRQLQGVLNVPVSSTFAIRLAAQLDDHGYLTKNVLPGGLDAGDQNYTATRVSLRFKPSDVVDATYKFENGDTHGAYGETDPLVTLGVSGGDVIRKPDCTNGYGFNSCASGTNGPNRIASFGLNQGFNKIQSHLLRVDWTLANNVSLASITGFLNQRYNVAEDCSGTPSIICNYDSFYQSKHYSQEFRLNGQAGRMNWTAGLYYLHQQSSGGLSAPLYFTADGNPTTESATTPGSLYYAVFDNSLRASAAYGQLEFAATDHVTLIAGLRVANDNRHFEERYSVWNILTPNSLFPFRDVSDFFPPAHQITSLATEDDFTAATAGGLTNSNHNSVSGTAQVNWQPVEGELFYASVRRGVKAAGFNNGSVPVGSIQTSQWPFGQEKLLAYEIGEKVSLSRSVRLNSAVFFYNYKDYQVTTFKGLGIIQSNAPATIKGFESEIVASPTAGLDISLGVSLLKTNIESLQRGAGLPFVDREMGEAPKVKVNASARYEWSAFGGKAFIQLSGDYVGERWTDAQNLTVGRLPSYTIVDGQIGFSGPKKKVAVLLWGRNLTNDRVPINTLATLTFANIGQQKWNEPPMGGVTIRYNF
ncbi:MAG: TonB-dependent receptor [Betaproteobacteria bacterium]